MDHLNRYENKSIFYTRLSLVGNICWVSLKLILGFLVSYVFLASALFQIFIVISKAYLYFNIKKRDYAKIIDYHFVGIITLFASVLYGFYFLSIRDNLKNYEMNVAILFAIAAFVEIGVSLFGIFKTKKGVPLFHILKLLNFSVALTSLVLCQRAICSFADTAGEMDFLNKYMGFIVSIIIFMISLYIYFGAHLGRDNCYYTYKGKISGDIYMTKSRIYPNYYYKYICENNLITGKIEISKNPLFHKNIFVTVLIIVFSEILIFPYLLGLLFFQIRYSNIGLKLDKNMSDRNLKKLHITDNEFDNIYKLNVSDLDFSFLIEYLPSNLQKKYHNISNLSYKNISLAGYFLLLNAIYDYYGVYYFPDFKEGKPFDLALDFKFNISHSKNVVVLATSYDEVGIDIEYKRKLSDEVKKRLFENEKINDKSATRKWTKLESAIKLEGSSILKYENINFKKYHINTIFQDDYAISRAKFKKIRKAI